MSTVVATTQPGGATFPPPGEAARRPFVPTVVAKPGPNVVNEAHGGPRLMYYCHDTFGLGHLRRTLKIATSLAIVRPDASHLVVTGSPVPQRFVIPDGIDYVKLPSVVKVGAERYEARSLALPFNVIRDVRRGIVSSLADGFRPDVLLVDHSPAGLAGEALDAVEKLRTRSPRAQLVLGLRDVIDEPVRVRAAWHRQGVHRLLDDVYDLILVYGHREVYDVVEAYGLSERAAAKVCYVGYLGSPAPAPERIAEVRRALSIRTNRLVVVTVGGGGDGRLLISTMLDGLGRAGRPEFDCLMVAGPLMSAADREPLASQAAKLPGVSMADFVDDMPALMGAADVVVSMGGYNSVCEVLGSGRPALLVPRVEPRREQLIRAMALQQGGLLRLVHPNELSPSRLMAEVRQLLDVPPAMRLVGLAGLSDVASRLAAVMPRPIAASGGVS